MVAQGAHASLKVVLEMQQKDKYKDLISEWLSTGMTKICLGVSSEEKLMELRDSASDAGIPVSIIVDVGKTEFHGEPTLTAIAIGPFDRNAIDKITGTLELL